MVKNLLLFFSLILLLFSCSTYDSEKSYSLDEYNIFQKNGSYYRLVSLEGEEEKELLHLQLPNREIIKTRNYILEKEIDIKSLQKEYRVIYQEAPYFIENDIYYFYNFELSYFFEGNSLFPSDLEELGVNASDFFIYIRNNGEINFVKKEEAEKRKIVEVNTLNFLSKKAQATTLKYLINDIAKAPLYSTNYDFLLRNLKREVDKRTLGLSQEEKIRVLYDWAVSTLSYNYEPENPAIFSGLETYYYKAGVCDGYSKLFIYKLLFAGIEDVEQIVGHVLNSEDLWIVGHAWVRIGNYYYDPTFENTRIHDGNTNQHFYYKLPRELMNADRLEGLDDIENEFLELSLEERKLFVEKSYLYLMLQNIYDPKNYPILNFYIQKNILTGGIVRELYLEDFIREIGITPLNNLWQIEHKWELYFLLEYSEIFLKDEPNYLETVLYFLWDKENIIIVEQNREYFLLYDMILKK